VQIIILPGIKNGGAKNQQNQSSQPNMKLKKSHANRN
jgi:hypothetical protein